MKNQKNIMKKTIILFAFCFLQTAFCQAQHPELQKNRANVWYFGTMITNSNLSAGLNFNSGSPVALTNGVGGNIDGPATISDMAGNYLFHNTGYLTWAMKCLINSNQVMLSNSDSLLGDQDASQGMLMVPNPDSNNIIYAFYISDITNARVLHYSVVDMNLDGGLGGVVPGRKNIPLSTDLRTERMAAVHHCNGKDVWVISTIEHGNKYFAYLVTGSGIDTNDIVISTVGLYHNAHYNGCLKFSPNGRKLVITIANESDPPQLFDFDNSTGIVSSPITLVKDTFESYASFSPDNSKLYIVDGNGKLIQYDLKDKDSAEIISSRTVVRYIKYDALGEMQNAVNGKIYIGARWDSVAVINYPNLQGTACGFQDHAIPLNGGQTGGGLARFIESYFNTDSSAFPCDSNQAINRIDDKITFDLFPNPFNISAILKIYGMKGEKVELSLYDFLGRLMMKSEISDNIYEIKRGNLTEGVYFLWLKIHDKYYSQKIIIIN